MHKGWATLIVGLFLLLGPGPVLFAGVWAWRAWDAERAQASWPLTDVAVDSCVESRDPRTGYWSYHYYAHRSMPDGQSRAIDGFSPTCTPGERYQLRYNPEDPNTVVFLEGDASYFAAVIPAFLGLTFTFLGLRGFFRSRRDAAATPPAAPPAPPA